MSESNKKKRIAIVDDHGIIHQGLEMILSSHYGRENLTDFSNGTDLIESLKQKEKVFDLIILDIQLPDVMAFSLVPKILKLNNKQAILIFSMYPEEVMAEPMLEIGANGYINKQSANSEILKAVDKVLKGETFISNKLKSIFSERYLNKDSFSANPFNSLSTRELEVAMLLMQGMGILEVSNTLNLKTSTVATYKSRVFEKMSVENIVELYHKGIILGLV